MAPTVFVVREKFVEGEPFRALVFGVSGSRKWAMQCRRRILAQIPAPCAQVELVSVILGYTYDLGTGVTDSPEDPT